MTKFVAILSKPDFPPKSDVKNFFMGLFVGYLENCQLCCFLTLFLMFVN